MSRFLKALASTKLTVVLLFLLSILVVWGTLYQAEFGLFAAQKRFYQSYMLLIGNVVPFPGAKTVLSLLFFNLLSAVLVTIRYSLRNAGSVLTHVGLLLFLLGGFVIQLYTREASLTLAEGEGSNVASSYQNWEVAMWPADQPSGAARRMTTVAANHFTPGSSVEIASLGARVEVVAYHPNATPVSPDGGAAVQNASGIQALAARPRKKEPAEDIPGGIFRITTPDGRQANLLLYGMDRGPTPLPIGDTTWLFGLRRQRMPLPFTVVLNDFQREMHLQSSMARSFASEVTLITGEVSRPVRISMNQPLRYGGFTLYQSSYRETADKEYSTFAVVYNRGRYLPYAGTLVVFVGMGVHFVRAILRKRLQRA